METKTVTLSDGTVLVDARSIGCSIKIVGENTQGKYASLSYSKSNGFYINMSSAWLRPEDVPVLVKELERLENIMREAIVLTSEC